MQGKLDAALCHSQSVTQFVADNTCRANVFSESFAARFLQQGQPGGRSWAAARAWQRGHASNRRLQGLESRLSLLCHDVVLMSELPWWRCSCEHGYGVHRALVHVFFRQITSDESRHFNSIAMASCGMTCQMTLC